MKRISMAFMLSVALCLIGHAGYAQRGNGNAIITVVDGGGQPIKNARVFTNEGVNQYLTDVEGKVRLKKKNSGGIRIEAPEFRPQTQQIGNLRNGDNIKITLIDPDNKYDGSEVIAIPFGQLERKRIVGAVDQLNTSDLLQYDNKQDVLGAINGRVPGVYGTNNLWGLGGAIIVIDGIPRSSSDASSRLNMAGDINLAEVENITVLKDVTSKMLYGAKADQGVVLITTKRGKMYRRDLKVYAESAVNNPISYPNFLSASDYMILYNEARKNDGLAPRFSDEDIQNTYNKTDPIRYPDESFYNSTYLKDNTIDYNVFAEASGGNENARYFTFLGFGRQGSLFKTRDNNGKQAAQQHINFRGNVDLKINSFMEANIDAIAIYHYNRYPNGYSGNGYDGTLFSFATTQLPTSFPTLIPISMIQDSALLSSAKLVDDQYVLGGTNQFQNNIMGNLIFGGMQSTQRKGIQLNSGLKIDLSSITKGLSANVNFTYDFLNSFTLRQENTYSIYEPTFLVDSDGNDSLALTQYGTDSKRDDQTVNGNYFQRRYGVYGYLNYDRTLNSVHKISATGLAFMTAYTIGRSSSSNYAYSRDQHFGLRLNYMYKDRYVVEFDGAYVGSSYLSWQNRYGFSPSLGAGWILSEEDFLKNNSIVKYLKIRSSYGVLKTDNGFDSYRLYDDRYTIGSLFSYNDGSGNSNYVTKIGQISNPDLTFVRQREFNLGFESSLFSDNIWVEGSYFLAKTLGLPTVRTSAYTAYLGGFAPVENYNERKVEGYELGLNYKNESNKFKYILGLNMIHSVPTILKLNEIEKPFEYQMKQGKVRDAIFAYVAEGLFMDQNDIDTHADQSALGPVQRGDIKYKDINEDGVINADDQMMIGNSNSRYQFGLNITLTYGRFSLYALGISRIGSSTLYTNRYMWVFGNRKYSDVVLNRWTPETAATATYPRLTTTSGANNFVESSYWLYNDDYFKLNKVQLTYHIPARSFWREMQIYFRGENLLLLSPNRMLQQLNIGSAPQTRSFVVGLVGSF